MFKLFELKEMWFNIVRSINIFGLRSIDELKHLVIFKDTQRNCFSEKNVATCQQLFKQGFCIVSGQGLLYHRTCKPDFLWELAFAKFLSRIKGNFWWSAVSMILALYYKFPIILDRNIAKANSTENQVCMSYDIVVLVSGIEGIF